MQDGLSLNIVVPDGLFIVKFIHSNFEIVFLSVANETPSVSQDVGSGVNVDLLEGGRSPPLNLERSWQTTSTTYNLIEAKSNSPEVHIDPGRKLLHPLKEGIG